MKTRIRLLAGAVTLAGAALLASPRPAHSTMPIDKLDPLGTRYCCAVDVDGDKRADSYCCYASGCIVGSTGCRRAVAIS